jgi:hypothetical protein
LKLSQQYGIQVISKRINLNMLNHLFVFSFFFLYFLSVFLPSIFLFFHSLISLIYLSLFTCLFFLYFLSSSFPFLPLLLSFSIVLSLSPVSSFHLFILSFSYSSYLGTYLFLLAYSFFIYFLSSSFPFLPLLLSFFIVLSLSLSFLPCTQSWQAHNSKVYFLQHSDCSVSQNTNYRIGPT